MMKLVMKNITQTSHNSHVMKYMSSLKNPLGRWSRTDAELKSYQANIDNCSGILCGTAQYTKQTLLSKVCKDKHKRKSPKPTPKTKTPDTLYNDEYLRYFF